MSIIEYAKVEVRIDGRTYVYELEPDEHTPIVGNVELENESRETTWDDPEDVPPWRTFAPTGRSFVKVDLSGRVAPRRVEGGQTA